MSENNSKKNVYMAIAGTLYKFTVRQTLSGGYMVGKWSPTILRRYRKGMPLPWGTTPQEAISIAREKILSEQFSLLKRLDNIQKRNLANEKLMLKFSSWPDASALGYKIEDRTDEAMLPATENHLKL